MFWKRVEKWNSFQKYNQRSAKKKKQKTTSNVHLCVICILSEFNVGQRTV